MLNAKLQTHLQRRYVRYRTKPNTALENKVAFVHLNCIVHSAALRGRTRNLREQNLPLS
jgi:hypothetical protein